MLHAEGSGGRAIGLLQVAFHMLASIGQYNTHCNCSQSALIFFLSCYADRSMHFRKQQTPISLPFNQLVIMLSLAMGANRHLPTMRNQSMTYEHMLQLLMRQKQLLPAARLLPMGVSFTDGLLQEMRIDLRCYLLNSTLVRGPDVKFQYK